MAATHFARHNAVATKPIPAISFRASGAGEAIASGAAFPQNFGQQLPGTSLMSARRSMSGE